jgi:hypothetical protein
MWVFKDNVAWDIYIILAAEFAKGDKDSGISKAIWGKCIKVVKRDKQRI